MSLTTGVKELMEKPAGEISLSEFCELQRAFVKLHAEYKAKEKELKDFKDGMEPVNLKIQAIMLSQNLKSMPVDDSLLVLSQQAMVPTPKTKEDKEAFFQWLLQEKGEALYWHYIGVNSMSLNAFYKEEREAAVERQDIDFKIPGVGKEYTTHKLSVRKR